MTSTRGRAPASWPFWVAAGAGTIHAGFSAYWALGGRWLLDTVGAWAVDLADRNRAGSASGLGAIAVLKLAGAVVPLLTERHQPGPTGTWRRRGATPRAGARTLATPAIGSRWRTRLRGLEWAGAGVLVLYGGINTAVAWLVLGGAIVVDGGYDRAAELGHAALWDPLFLIWGLSLATGLRATRDR